MQIKQSPFYTSASRFFAFVAGKLTVAGVAAFLALIIFARFSAEFNENGRLRLVDTNTLAFFGAHRIPWLFVAMRGVTWAAGSGPQAALVAVFVLVLTFRKKFWPQAAVLLLASIGGMGAVIALKLLFHRPRPELIFAPLGYSFPSGHSFFAVVIYGTLAYWLALSLPTRRRPLVWAACVFLILLVGFSRMYLGEHYPSDVGAGYSAGVFWIWVCLSLPGWVTHFRKARPGKTP